MAQLFMKQDHAEAFVDEFVGGRAAVFSRRCPEKTTPNEDAAALIDADESRGAIVVADGCGGMSDGDEASLLAILALHSSVQAAREEGGSLRGAILDGIEKANQQVRALGTGAATTLAAVELEGDTMRCYHVGDSQILLVGGRGKIKLQTAAHSPVGYAIEAGMISEEEALHHEDRYLVSNVVGSPDTHIEIGPRRRLSPRDTLLVASDGLFDNLLLEEIVEIIRKGPLDRAASRLVEKATVRMKDPDEESPSKPDDLTFVLYRQRIRTTH